VAGDANVLTYGTAEEAQLRASGITQTGRSMTFTVTERGTDLGQITLGSPGLHNIRNALGAWAMAQHAGAPFGAAQAALPAFSGVARRFQELGTASGITVVDDYAHHPTEIDATLSAARGSYPDRRLVAAFQPHLYSRTRDLAVDFGRALAEADVVWVADVFPAREAPIEGVSGELVADAARRDGGAEVHYTPTLDEMNRTLRAELRDGDVLVAMGAGDIDEMALDIFTALGGE
jgi:UDP-N-acetylmuramate--alanine ligase